MTASEHRLQAACFKWAHLNRSRWPELKMMFAIPNGGARSKVTGAMLKAEGVKAGVPDIFLPVPRGRYSGMFIEMKTPKGKLADNQRNWLIDLKAQNYLCKVCRSVGEFTETVSAYLDRQEMQDNAQLTDSQHPTQC